MHSCRAQHVSYSMQQQASVPRRTEAYPSIPNRTQAYPSVPERTQAYPSVPNRTQAFPLVPNRVPKRTQRYNTTPPLGLHPPPMLTTLNRNAPKGHLAAAFPRLNMSTAHTPSSLTASTLHPSSTKTCNNNNNNNKTAAAAHAMIPETQNSARNGWHTGVHVAYIAGCHKKNKAKSTLSAVKWHVKYMCTRYHSVWASSGKL